MHNVQPLLALVTGQSEPIIEKQCIFNKFVSFYMSLKYETSSYSNQLAARIKAYG